MSKNTDIFTTNPFPVTAEDRVSVSEQLLKVLTELNKPAAKLLVAMLYNKVGEDCLHCLEPNGLDSHAYYRAIKELESKQIIKVTRLPYAYLNYKYV